MLDPQSRRHLFETLRPPEGYMLDCAVGTTFSLNLLTLLTVPLAFTLFASEDEQGQPLQDPLTLLDSLRRYANRLSIFCQAGQIHVPKTSQLLFGYLESSVFEVIPPPRAEGTPSRGVFHPKVWLLRYTPEQTSISSHQRPIHYRFLCLSRNLTFDRSWDTMLVLDGDLQNRTYAYPQNHPLGDFIASLPGLTIHPISETAQSRVDMLQDEVRRVMWTLPEYFKSLEFCPIGLTRRHRWPFNQSKYRLLVVSPFLTPGFLRDISKGCEQNTLVSRLEEVEKLSRDQLNNFQKIYVLSPEADIDLQDDANQTDPQPPSKPELDSLLAGLHAKLYIFESGWDAYIWTGSANATSAAMKENVEFLVKLKGKKSKIGIDKILDFDSKAISFADLLQEYTPSGEPVAGDKIQERLDEQVIQTQRALVQIKLKAVVLTNTKIDSKNDEYQIKLIAMQGEMIPDLSNVEIYCWPITRSQDDGTSVNPGATPLAQLGPLSFVALTSFFAFEIKASEGKKTAVTRFVLNIPLENAPTDRQERLLRYLLQNKRQVMHYLLFLLAEEGDSYEVIAALLTKSTRENAGDGSLGLPINLFEALIRALERNPAKLDQIARLISDLEQTDDGLSLLPDHFMDIWQPIWETRQRLAQKQKGKASSFSMDDKSA